MACGEFPAFRALKILMIDDVLQLGVTQHTDRMNNELLKRDPS